MNTWLISLGFKMGEVGKHGTRDNIEWFSHELFLVAMEDSSFGLKREGESHDSFNIIHRSSLLSLNFKLHALCVYALRFCLI